MIDGVDDQVQYSHVFICLPDIQTYKASFMDKRGNETFEDVKYFEWHNPAIQKYLNGELTEYELVNAIFEPFEQVSQKQAQLLGTTFEMLSGGPAQTHVGTGGGGSSSDMPWGEEKNDGNMTTYRRKRWHLVANQ